MERHWQNETLRSAARAALLLTATVLLANNDPRARLYASSLLNDSHEACVTGMTCSLSYSNEGRRFNQPSPGTELISDPAIAFWTGVMQLPRSACNGAYDAAPAGRPPLLCTDVLSARPMMGSTSSPSHFSTNDSRENPRTIDGIRSGYYELAAADGL